MDRLGWNGYPPQIYLLVVSSWDDMIGALMGGGELIFLVRVRMI